jgi:hypothetical protein
MSIAAGAAVLDQHVPGWRDRIDTDTLDLANCHACVLGQLYGNFIRGLEVVGPAGTSLTAKTLCAAEHGFYAVGAGDDDLHQEYQQLTDGWREEIARRRGESVA